MKAGDVVELRCDEPAPILAARLATATPAGGRLPELFMRLATTRGTNALLQRSGARAALFITEGFGDALTIGDQQRPDLFALRIERQPPLWEVVEEVPERVGAEGEVLRPLDAETVERAALALVEQGITTAAVALVHARRNDAHERQVEAILAAPVSGTCPPRRGGPP